MNNVQGEPVPGSTVQVDITTVGSNMVETNPNTVGTIFGDVGTNSFKFAVTGSVERSDYIVARHPDCGDVLCQVGSIVRKTTMTLENVLLLDMAEYALDDGDHYTDLLFNVKEKAMKNGFLMAILKSCGQSGKVKLKVQGGGMDFLHIMECTRE